MPTVTYGGGMGCERFLGEGVRGGGGRGGGKGGRGRFTTKSLLFERCRLSAVTSLWMDDCSLLLDTCFGLK